MEVTLESLATEIAEIKSMITGIFNSQSVQQTIFQAEQNKAQAEQMAEIKVQQKLQQLQQERQMITQLQMEGYSKEEAIVYYERMLKGEKPWLDSPATV
jgi:quinolinate synthase